MGLDRFEQGRSLEAVAAGSRTCLFLDEALVDLFLDRSDDQADAGFGDPTIAVFDHLGEVVARVDVHDRERHLGRGECLDGHVKEKNRVLAAREEQRRTFEFRRYLPNDVDRLCLQGSNISQLIGHCSPVGSSRV